MRLYEIVYIFDASLDEDAVNAKLERFQGELTGAAGAEVVAVDHWGVRQFAYPINKTSSGYYVIAQVRTTPDGLPAFERLLKLDEQVIRYLIVLNEGEPTSGQSLVVERPVRSTDDDEEDESDDEADDEDDEDERRAGPPEFSGGRGRRRRMDGPRIELLNYKDVGTLSRFLTEQGKILPKRTTKVTARFQRQLGRAVKRARYLALIPYTRRHEG
ncbi:MAG: 30S ribosomal protein S6 [Gemmatimonadetes bacterium]|nr:MAG: 30S ribosomal protein S6 [Gemmatimonadota bacterium]